MTFFYMLYSSRLNIKTRAVIQSFVSGLLSLNPNDKLAAYTGGPKLHYKIRIQAAKPGPQC